MTQYTVLEPTATSQGLDTNKLMPFTNQNGVTNIKCFGSTRIVENHSAPS
jgi:hypothetical protein